MFSHPELGSDLPIGSDWESGCDKEGVIFYHSLSQITLLHFFFIIFFLNKVILSHRHGFLLLFFFL